MVPTREKALQNPLNVLYEGKEITFVNFYTDLSRQVVWVHLLPEHSCSPAFWELFRNITKYMNKDKASVLLKDSAPWETHTFIQKLMDCIEELDPASPYFLVFENFHLLSDGPAKAFLVWLLKHPVQNESIALISDSEIDLRRDAVPEHYELSGPDYTLTREEVQVYLMAHQKRFQKDDLDYLCNITQCRSSQILGIVRALHQDNVLSRMIIYQAMRRSEFNRKHIGHKIGA